MLPAQFVDNNGRSSGTARSVADVGCLLNEVKNSYSAIYTRHVKSTKHQVARPRIWSRFRGPAMHGNVSLNCTQFPRAALGAYARAYRDAADRLVTELRSKVSYSDVEACPIVFLYRHAVELGLKEIVYWGNGLLHLRGQHSIVGPRVLFRTHDLAKLATAAKPIFGLFNCLGHWSDSEFKSFADFSRFIAELNGLDPGSYAFRYPIDRNGASSLPQQLCFNVLTFGRKLNSLLETLDGLATMAYEEFQAEAQSLGSV